MKQHLQILINLLKKNDLKGLLQHYVVSDSSDNLAQLAFVYQQGLKNLPRFEFYQQLGCKFIDSKGLPSALIAHINNADALSFFTPALQLQSNFSKTNQQQNNVLHYLFAANINRKVTDLPPFNYLRSMMLFESNETLHDALCQRNEQQLTPIEGYLSSHQNLTDLPSHEFTALLAIIEIESKKQPVDDDNYLPVIQAVKKICTDQTQRINAHLQRLQFIATYYAKPVNDIVEQLSTR